MLIYQIKQGVVYMKKKKALILAIILSFTANACSMRSNVDEEHEIISIEEVVDAEIIVNTPIPSIIPVDNVMNYEDTIKIEDDLIEDEIVNTIDNDFIEINSYGFIKSNTSLYNNLDERIVIDTIDEYQKVYSISTNYEYNYIQTMDGVFGYIESNKFEFLPSNYVEVDISDQLVTVYYDNNAVLSANVVTGASGHDTNIGYQEILEKTYNRPLIGPTWNVDVNYFFPFNYDGEGFHDASWRSEFGGNIYVYNGSHGCVNMNIDDVNIMDNYIDVGTKVLVHK